MWLSFVVLLWLSLFGFKSLFIFCTRNGTLQRLGDALAAGTTPSRQPLRPLTTGIGSLDTQIRATAIFQLLFCENTANLDASLVNYSFLGAWGSAWFLTILESFRVYSSRRFLSWTAIPGVLVFNYSHAVITPLYFAIWLALKPSISTEGLLLTDASYVRVFPWTILLGYVLPLVVMMLPSRRIGNIDTKHTMAGWYQQYHLYISLVHWLLVALWPSDESAVAVYNEPILLESAYRAVFVLAALTTYWLPIVVCCWATLCSRNKRLSFTSVWVPFSPFRDMQMSTVWQGAKCLLQWDGIVGTAATLVWAATLYFEARSLVIDPEPVSSVAKKLAISAFIGGPMGIPIRLLYERDMMVLA